MKRLLNESTTGLEFAQQEDEFAQYEDGIYLVQIHVHQEAALGLERK
jgi:hypothetical protein